MTRYDQSLNQAVEFAMISTDAEFCRQLIVEAFIKNKSGILPFGLTPYLSLFVIETYKYFGSRVPGFTSLAKRQNANIIQASRTRSKLYEGREDVTTLMNHLEWIVRFSRGWMNIGHVGLAGWLKRWIQPDMGLYFCDGHLVSTTHVAFYNLGYEEGNIAVTTQGEPIGLDELSHSVGRDIGEYIGLLSAVFTRTLGTSTSELCQYQMDHDAFSFADKKALSFLRSLDTSNTPLHINSCLLLALSTVNFILYVFRKMVVNEPNTWFKIKFLTLYHVILSLTTLQNNFYKSGLSTKSKQLLAYVLADKELRMLRSKSAFRNIIVHYGIRNVPESNLRLDCQYFGLVEHFFGGAIFNDVNNVIDLQLVRLSAALEDWMSVKSQLRLRSLNSR
jgi:hypothetical protein